jgi:hypothetical protein
VTSDSEVDDWINITVDYHQLCSWLSINTNSLLHEKAMLSMLMEAKHAQEEQCDWTDESPHLLTKLHAGELKDINVYQMHIDEDIMNSDGIDCLLNNRSSSLRYLGKSRKDLISYFGSIKDMDTHRISLFFELMDYGQTEIMLPIFHPNGGRNFTQSSKYKTHTILCAHEIATRQEEGRIVVVRESAILNKNELHYSRLTTAAKFQSTDRMCFDLTSAVGGGMSFNESIDETTHLEKWPRDTLPTLSKICEFLCDMRNKFPSCGYLDGSTVDIRTAYNQYTISASKSKLLVTRFVSPNQPDIPLVAFPVTGVFGEKFGGEPLTAVFTYAINKILNSQNLTCDEERYIISNAAKDNTRWAMPYVDDIMIVAPSLPSRWDEVDTSIAYTDPLEEYNDPSGGTNEYHGMEIHSRTLAARNVIAHLLGVQATLKRKVKVYKGHLEALGWNFNLHYNKWFVAPKHEKLLKIFYFLFVVISPSATSATSDSIEIISGLLNWYMSAIPIGRCFTHSLFKLGHKWQTEVTLSKMSIRDLSFWRAIILCALTDISVIGAPINTLCLNIIPSWYIHTDASTGIGGGGFLSSINKWIRYYPNPIFVLRWTVDELDAIKIVYDRAETISHDINTITDDDAAKYIVNSGDYQRAIKNGVRRVNINVLEFASAVYAILLWSYRLKHCVVDIGTDNTACLCWLVRQKAQSISADRLLKVLALNGLIFDIRLRSHYIPGVDNIIPDYLSRNLEWSHLDIMQKEFHLASPLTDIFLDNLSKKHYSHKQLCRAIIHQSLVVEEPLMITELLAIVDALQRHHTDVSDFNNQDLLNILDNLIVTV